MHETKVPHDDEEEEENMKDSRDDMHPSDCQGDDVKKHVDCKSGDGSGTDSQGSEPSIKEQESEPVEGLDHECDVITPQVSVVARESDRGFTGFDLNEEFCSNEKPECSLSGTYNDSKKQPRCLDIDLNVADDNEDKDMILSGLSFSLLSSSSSKESLMKDFDLNNGGSLDNRKGVMSLFGTQVEVLEPTSKAGWVHGSFAPLSRMVDPRGVHVAPPYVMNLAGGPCSGPTRSGPLQQNAGVNLGLNLMMSSGSSSLVIGGKRHEPDGGWEAFPVKYKH